MNIYTQKSLNTNYFINYTLDQLINSNVYLGFNKCFSAMSCFSFLLGVKLNVYIINLLTTISSLKVCYSFLSVLLKYYGGLWIIDLLKYSRIILTKAMKILFLYNKYRLYIWDQIWEAGLISNYLGVRRCPKIIWPLHLWYPSTVFFLNSLTNPNAILETQSIKLLLPFISIIDTNTTLLGENYRIPGNEKNFNSFGLFFIIILKFLYRLLLLKDIFFFMKVIKKKLNE